MDKKGYTYILANKKNGTIYTGVTSNMERRMLEHKYKIYGGFSEKYGTTMLVWLQEFPTIEEAITYEKKIKGWKRSKKLLLIEQDNPQRNDLFGSQ